MKTLKNVLVVALLLMGTTLLAQTKLTGKVVDEYGQPLPGSDVIVEGTNDGAATDFDGKFTFDTAQSSGTLTVTFMGYFSKSLNFNGSKDFGTIEMEASAESLDEIVITGTGVIDLAADRKTPIAVSSITASEIKSKVGNFDLPELLTNTPSVQAVKGGGYGDGAMYLRGFDQTNTAFLLNGQPINGMEDGKMYWSNWSGIMDIANAVQVQRGLGSSKLAISSVGGTVNIVTKTVDAKQGGFVQGLIGNDNYYKGTAYYSTGIMENGLAVGFMLGHWQGDGYRNGTAGQGQTYYLSFGYKPNDDNIFNFLVTGAPQWHGDAWTRDLQTYLDKGRKFNPYYGYKDGEIYQGLRNFYHKPIVNFSWDWNISDDSKLSTVLYGSLGRGGYAYMEGAAWGLVDTDVDGGMDFDSLVESNEAADYANGYQKGSYNGHNWYGLVTNFEKTINENVSVNFGGDVRMYNGMHFRAPVDLMGGSHFDHSSDYSGDYRVDNVFGGFDPWAAVYNFNNDHKQRYKYDYEENINYYGVFAQIEYSKDKFSTFFQGSVSNQNHVATDFYNYDTAKVSESISNLGYNVKAGLSYKVNENNTSFVNAGYYSRQPFHDNLFINLRKGVDLNELANINESILGIELGHNLKFDRFKMGINLYHTVWGNRTHVISDNSDPSNIINFQVNGINEIHDGAEIDFSYKPITNVRLKGFGSLGNWRYGVVPTVKVFSEETGDDITSTYEGDLIGSYEEGDKIGGAAQFSAGLGMDWTIVKNLKFDVSQRFYDNLFSLGGIELPSYSLTDAGLSYKLKLEKKSIDFRVNVNNLFDEFYISRSNGSTKVLTQADFTMEDPENAGQMIPDEEGYNTYFDGLTTWRGVDTTNNVRIGYGRTWNASVRFNF